MWQLMHDHLRHARFKVVGHDWGSPVAFRLAADHPDAVSHLALIEIGVLGDQPESVFGSVVPTWWHLFFQVPDLPEALTFGRERLLLEYMLTFGAGNPTAFSDDDIREYVWTYSLPGAMRAGFDYYRAANQDTADNRATFASGFKLSMPALGLGGSGPLGRGEAVVESLRRVAIDADGGTIPFWLEAGGDARQALRRAKLNLEVRQTRRSNALFARATLAMRNAGTPIEVAGRSNLLSP